MASSAANLCPLSLCEPRGVPKLARPKLGLGHVVSAPIGDGISAENVGRLKVWKLRAQRSLTDEKDSLDRCATEPENDARGAFVANENLNRFLSNQVSDPAAPSQEVSVLSWTLSAETHEQRMEEEEEGGCAASSFPQDGAGPDAWGAAPRALERSWVDMCPALSKIPSPPSADFALFGSDVSSRAASNRPGDESCGREFQHSNDFRLATLRLDLLPFRDDGAFSHRRRNSDPDPPTQAAASSEEETETLAWLQYCSRKELGVEADDVQSVPDENASCSLNQVRQSPPKAGSWWKKPEGRPGPPSTVATTTSSMGSFSSIPLTAPPGEPGPLVGGPCRGSGPFSKPEEGSPKRKSGDRGGGSNAPATKKKSPSIATSSPCKSRRSHSSRSSCVSSPPARQKYKSLNLFAKPPTQSPRKEAPAFRSSPPASRRSPRANAAAHGPAPAGDGPMQPERTARPLLATPSQPRFLYDGGGWLQQQPENGVMLSVEEEEEEEEDGKGSTRTSEAVTECLMRELLRRLVMDKQQQTTSFRSPLPSDRSAFLRREEQAAAEEQEEEDEPSQLATKKTLRPAMARLRTNLSGASTGAGSLPLCLSAEDVVQRLRPSRSRYLHEDSRALARGAQLHAAELLDTAPSTDSTISKSVARHCPTQNHADLESLVRNLWAEADSQVTAVLDERDQVIRQTEVEKTRLSITLQALENALRQRAADFEQMRAEFVDERRKLRARIDELEETLDQWQRSLDRAKTNAQDRQHQYESNMCQMKDLLTQKEGEAARLVAETGRLVRDLSECQAALQKTEDGWARQLSEAHRVHEESARVARLKHEEELNILESQWKQALFSLRQIVAESQGQAEALQLELQRTKTELSRERAEADGLRQEKTQDKTRLGGLEAASTVKDEEIAKLRVDCEDLALSCKKTKKAFDSLKKAHVPVDEYEILRETLEDSKTSLGALKAELDAALREKEQLLQRTEELAEQCAALEKSTRDRDVNVTVKGKMLEEQGVYLANMRVKLQTADREIGELKAAQRKRDELANKLTEENRELRSKMPPEKVSQQWTELKSQNEDLRRELQEKHAAFDLVLSKLDELEREQRREKERHDKETQRVREELAREKTAQLAALETQFLSQVEKLTEEAANTRRANEVLQQELQLKERAVTGLGAELGALKEATGERLSEVVKALTAGANK